MTPIPTLAWYFRRFKEAGLSAARAYLAAQAYRREWQRRLETISRYPSGSLFAVIRGRLRNYTTVKGAEIAGKRLVTKLFPGVTWDRTNTFFV